MSGGRRFLSQWMLVLAVLLLTIMGTWAIIANRPQLEHQPTLPETPRVHVIRIKPQTIRLNVHSQGIAAPRTKIDLAPEVAGKIIKLHPQLVAGGFFAKGEVLVTIDPRDYDYAIIQAKAKIAEAKRQLETEKALAKHAYEDWQTIGVGKATPLALHLPQLAEARTRLTAAEADLAKAHLQRSRCGIKAPFAGRVSKEHVGIGQYVQVGEKLARLYSTDIVEIRLPLSTEQLAFIEFPLGPDKSRVDGQPKVVLSHKFDGLIHQWQGRIVRMEGAVDAMTGLIYVVAEVRNPFVSKDRSLPLLDGLFVQAEIEGREQEGIFVLPQGAVNSTQKALLVNTGNRLHIQSLTVLREETDNVLVKSGLAAGDQVIISGIQVPIEGMKVRIEQAQISDQLTEDQQ